MPSQRQAKRHKPSKPSKPSEQSSDRANKALILLVDGATRELLLIYSAKHAGWGGSGTGQGRSGGPGQNSALAKPVQGPGQSPA